MRGAAARFLAFALAIGALGVGGAASTVAQEEAPAPQPAPTGQRARTTGIEQITVTARKQEEALQDAPISVSALSGAEMEAQSVENIMDVQYQIPGLVLSQSPATGSTAFLAVRGITSSDFTPAVDSGVGVYIDEMYLSRTVALVRDLFDIERFELLRGPQGTLFGKNTTGGALQFLSRKPDGTWNGNVSVDVGNYDRYETKGAIGFPILGQTLSGRFAWVARARDNFSRSSITGNELEKQRTYYFRGALRWQPTEDVDFNLVAHRSKARDKATNAKFRAFNPQGSLAPFFSPTFATVLPNGQLFFVNQGTAPIDAAFGRPSPDILALDDHNFRSTGNRITSNNYAGLPFGEVQNDDVGLYVLNGSINLGNFTLRSVTGHFRLDADRSADQDGIPTDLFWSGDGYNTRAYQQEFRLSGSLWEDRIDLTTGLFGYYEEGENDALSAVLPESTQLRTVLAGGPCPFGPPVGLVQTLCFINASSRNNQQTENWSYAPFASVDFHATERLTLVLGARYTEERREARYKNVTALNGVYAGLFPLSSGTSALFDGECTLGENPNTGQLIEERLTGGNTFIRGDCRHTEQAFREDFWTWDSMARYQWTDSFMTFFRAGLSRRSGNHPPRPTNLQSLPATGPERLVQYELGLKSDWLDNRLRLNASVWHSNFSNIIVSNIQDVGGRTATISQNAARRYLQGYELELLTADLGMEGLRFWFNISGSHSRAVKDIRTDGFGNRVDFGRLNTGSVPRLKYGVGLAYTFPEFELGRLAGELTARADYSWQSRLGTFERAYSRTNPSVQCTAPGSVPAPLCRGNDLRLHTGSKTVNGRNTYGSVHSPYGLFNAQLSYEMHEIGTTITLWGRNLFDREYETAFIDFPFGVLVSYMGAPREYGISVTYRWGES
jgi:iron complex outermembrane receptor protein